ncbi:MAG: hypothetical protein L6461_15915, partial [Anaerolineae bacterium]|nr:hypothetical protein [Anaerolineae bacterium]
ALSVSLGFDSCWLSALWQNIFLDFSFGWLSWSSLKLTTFCHSCNNAEEYQNLIQEIEQVNPGFIFVSIKSPCPGKGEILIEYPSHQNRLQIEELIGDETFFGIPYRGINT